MLLGQRQPKERADALYVRFAQCVGAQAPGRLGRQPNWVLTESMPAARLGCSTMRSSSAVTGGSFMIASIAMAPGASSAVGSLSFVFLIRRACRNQSKIVS